jgi:sugar phosphate isomerase/epimerase/predicted metal-dependent hydrolase
MTDVAQQDDAGARFGALRLGVSTGAFFPQIATEDVPDIAARAGLTDLEIMPQTRGEYEPAFLRMLVARCRDAGCRVHALHSFQEMIPVTSPYARRAEEGRAFFDRTIAATRALGARVLVWHGPRRREVETPEGWEKFIYVTAELAAACGEAGITLALENVSWCALAKVRDLTAFASHLKEFGPPEQLGFVFDPFQAAEAGANPFLVLAAMLDRVVDVHLSDYRADDPDARHLPPGEGDLPWSALIRAITMAYAGPMMIEGSLAGESDALSRVQARLNPLIHGLLEEADPCQGTPPAGVVEGIRLFNEQQFYECHEEIEHEWHAERRPVRNLYQGILQIGVGLHHARGGNHRGAVLLLTDGIEKTSRFLPSCLGIDTARLVTESQACLDQIIALGPDRMERFDWAMVPRVHLPGT